MIKKDMFIILPEKDFKRDIKNMTITFNSSDYLYNGYEKIPNDLISNDNNIFEFPPFFCEVDLMSIILPIKKITRNINKNILNDYEKDIMWFCLYKQIFILVPNEHLHVFDNKYKYICL